MATVGEIWQLALPPGSILVAGEAGLWREINSTARLRPRPPGFEQLSGTEMAFVSLQSMHFLDENLTLAAVVSRLAEMGAAAIAVLGEVDARAVSAADLAGLPLFALPATVAIGDAEQGALRVLTEHQAEINRRAQDAYRQLTELAIAGRGLSAIVERLAQIAGKPAALQDVGGALRLYADAPESPLARDEAVVCLAAGAATTDGWPSGSPISASDPPVAKFPLTDAVARLVAPVLANNIIAGYLSLLAPVGSLSELDRLAVGRGAAACAIELARQQAALDAQDQLQIGVVDELLAGGAADGEAVRERAARLGYDLRQPHAAVVLRLPPTSNTKNSGELAKATERELNRLRMRAPLRPRGDSISVLMPLEADAGEAGLKRLAEGLRASVAARLGESELCAGLGRVHTGLDGLRLAHQEAEQALSLGMRVLGTGRSIYFGDLGLYRLLFNIAEKDELRRFHRETLGRLDDYDRRNNAELVATLAAYFTCNQSPTEAAERMHLHRNTFIYRLHRIRDISGLDLDDSETRLALHLALRVGDTLRATETMSEEWPASGKERGPMTRGRTPAAGDRPLRPRGDGRPSAMSPR
ncbi:MAG: helix-turn-helix domain-containing protein [Chloroflexota bacterium]